jgi:hypothetical protein
MTLRCHTTRFTIIDYYLHDRFPFDDFVEGLTPVPVLAQRQSSKLVMLVLAVVYIASI